jgi:hypothetical protein
VFSYCGFKSIGGSAQKSKFTPKTRRRLLWANGRFSSWKRDRCWEALFQDSHAKFLIRAKIMLRARSHCVGKGHFWFPYDALPPRTAEKPCLFFTKCFHWVTLVDLRISLCSQRERGARNFVLWEFILWLLIPVGIQHTCIKIRGISRHRFFFARERSYCF